MEESKKRRGEEEERRARYETADAKVVAVLVAGGIILAVLVAIASGAWWLYRYYQEVDRREVSPLTTPLTPAEPALPPEPRLQVSPQADLYRMRLKEERFLSTYGWADETSRVVRMPIDAAISRLAERGLPQAKDTGPWQGREQLQPTEPSSGRVWERTQP